MHGQQNVKKKGFSVHIGMKRINSSVLQTNDKDTWFI